jgi:hypothetical protein
MPQGDSYAVDRKLKRQSRHPSLSNQSDVAAQTDRYPHTVESGMVRRVLASPNTLRPADVQALSGKIGNAAVQRLLARSSTRSTGSERQAPPRGIVQRSPLRKTGAIVQRGILDFFRRKKNKPKQNLSDDDFVPGSSQALNSGTANSVFKVRTKESIGNSDTDRGFFKPDDESFTTEQGISMSNRAVASSKLNKYLGFNNIAENVYAEHQGQKGSVAAKVRGSPLFEMIRENGGLKGYHYNSPDMQDPKIQQGMSDLQLFDFITGQGDRHGGNIYVDNETGDVSGIDDDIAFGSDMAIFQRERDDEQLGTTDPDMKFAGLPELIDKRTAKRILGKKAKNLPKQLKGHLSDQEIKTTQARLRFVKAELKKRKKNKTLVNKWDRDTYDQTMSQAGRPGFMNRQTGKQEYYYRSYLRRHEEARQGAGQNDEVEEPVSVGGGLWEDNPFYN